MIGGAKNFFIFEDFDRQCLDVFMVVTNVIIILQCFKTTFMVSKYHYQSPLFDYYIVRCSRTEHPNKMEFSKLRFPYRIKN